MLQLISDKGLGPYSMGDYLKLEKLVRCWSNQLIDILYKCFQHTLQLQVCAGTSSLQRQGKHSRPLYYFKDSKSVSCISHKS